MKRVIIVSCQMIRGGVESALLSMLNALDENKFDITLLLMRNGGPWENRIPNYVHIVYMTELMDPKGYLKKLLRKNPVKALQGLYYFEKSVHTASFWEENAYLSMFLPKLRESYDVAVAYHAPGTLPVHYVINNIIAEKKVLWIHGDIEQTKSCGSECSTLYSKYHEVVCVSKEAERIFLKHNPSMGECTSTIYNLVDYNRIHRLSKELNFTKIFDVCTVARLSEEKGIDIAVEACYLLHHRGRKIRWVCCGTGNEEARIKEIIHKRNLEDYFILAGDQDNPYSYIANSTIYCQPSRHEGYCLTLAEARALCKPIVSTNFTGATEQLQNMKTGVIVPLSAKEIADAIEMLMNNVDLRQSMIENLKKQNKEVCSTDLEKVFSDR